jgi:hypothetical protein
MSNNQCHLLFPVVLGDVKLLDLVEPVNKIRKNCSAWYDNQSTSTSVLNEHPEIKEVFIREVQKFLSGVLNMNCDIHMTTSWFTKALPNEESHWHDHNNSWWSGCFYFHPNCKIGFRQDESQIFVKPSTYHNLNSSEMTFSPSVGTLYIFPSKTKHKGLINEMKINRYSLAFNFMPLGIQGHRDSSFCFGD